MTPYDENSFSPPAPVALVIIRVPNSAPSIADVPMLIDSGADVTLIPNAPVEFLRIAADTEDVYQLQGFDGSISESQAVRADLVFGRRTFKGRFLVVDRPYGILGRDVLNHLTITLDGPNLAWEAP